MVAKSRHAYLIIAHSRFEQLKILIELLDHERNDIFLYIDRRAKFTGKDLEGYLKKSRLIYVKKPSRLNWGGRNFIEGELELLKMAIQTDHYCYYHLLSGQDLPIKSNEIIFDFFEKEKGKEFIRFQSDTFQHQDRVKYYYPFSDYCGKKKGLLRNFEKVLIVFQKLIGVNRMKKYAIHFQKGTNWFSITDAFARWVVDHFLEYEGYFRKVLLCDEVFLHTMFINSPFSNNLYWPQFDNNQHAIMRLIDWKRGNPYIFRKSDFGEIMSSDLLFARKFDMEIDDEIILMIRRALKSSEVSEGRSKSEML